MSRTSIDLLENGAAQKKGQQQTQVFWPISSLAGSRFWTAKCPIPLAKPLKSGSQNGSRISLKTLLKGTSGFSSVVGTLLKLRLRRKNCILQVCTYRAKHGSFDFCLEGGPQLGSKAVVPVPIGRSTGLLDLCLRGRAQARNGFILQNCEICGAPGAFFFNGVLLKRFSFWEIAT